MVLDVGFTRVVVRSGLTGVWKCACVCVRVCPRIDGLFFGVGKRVRKKVYQGCGAFPGPKKRVSIELKFKLPGFTIG